MSHTNPPADTSAVVTVSSDDLEQLIRRIIREEFSRLLRSVAPNPIDDWRQEGPEDAGGDALLLQEALEALALVDQGLETTVSWAALKAELKQAEAAGELPS